MEIRQNYENYKRVKDAFKEFIHILVWESADIECGAPEDEIDEHIEKYCKNNADQMIALTNDSVSKFITSLYARYKVVFYECDGNGRSMRVVDTIKTDSMEVAIQKAAKYYRKGERPYVEVFDNETKRYILKLDV